MDANVILRLRRPRVEAKQTPLQFTITPEQVIDYAAKAPPDFAFIALAWFFFSLRTQEVLALTRADFRAGSRASELECAKVIRRAALYDRLAVHVTKQNAKSTKDQRAEPKANSKGWVACFDRAAAERLVALVKNLAEVAGDGPLVAFSVDYNLHRWARDGIAGITMKDLRRASLYWLGHHTNLGLVELKSHARHTRVDTTALYLRRPEEMVEGLDDLDLEA